LAIAPHQRELAQKLFEGALERPPAERASYLEGACPSDPPLREYLLHMIASGEQDPEFLETPVLLRMLNNPMLQAGDLVKGRFRILRLVGSGGMAEVYEASDIAHPEEPERVALKTIRRDLAGLEESEVRLRREVQLAHKVTHSNVCKIHSLDKDSRPEGDLLFLTMDFLEGEPLAQRLQRTGPLALGDTVRHATEIAAGLDAAHQEGVIHRDLKSANIMLVPRKDGTTRAVIMDFGIACLEEEVSRPGTGTYAYMPPERLGDRGATRSADIYSFGVILYEMTTGRLPFAPDTPPEERRKPPPAPGSLRRGLARRWNRTILRCLDPVPGRRFPVAADAVSALRPVRWPWAVAALLATLLLASPKLIEGWKAMVAPPRRTVAILPPDITGVAGPQAGLMGYLVEELQKNPHIRERWLIYSPAEARQMGVRSAAQARATFGAGYILAGTMMQEVESVTLTGRLLDAGDSRVVASFQKTCPLDNAVCLQDGMLQEISNVFHPRGSASLQAPPISKEALPHYLQGLQYLRRDSVSYHLAIPFFQQAIASDASAPQPRVAMADAYILRFRDSGDRAMLAEARKILDAVLASHPGLREAHASLGVVLRFEGRYEDSIRELLLAVQSDPTDHVFHRRLGETYDLAGRDAEAMAEFQKVIEMQPRYWAGYLGFAVFHYRRGQFQEAARLLETLLQWAPDHAQGLSNLGGVYVDMGRNADAERVSRRSCEISPARLCYVNLGIALQRQRLTRQAIDAYNRALALGTPSLMQLLNTADAYAYIREQPEAEKFFRRAIAKAQEQLKVNLRDSGARAILAYCKAQIGDREGALFELEQALESAPQDKNVQKYAVLSYESLGLRDKALDTLRRLSKPVLHELEQAWGTEQLRTDPRYPSIAREIKNK